MPKPKHCRVSASPINDKRADGFLVRIAEHHALNEFCAYKLSEVATVEPVSRVRYLPALLYVVYLTKRPVPRRKTCL